MDEERPVDAVFDRLRTYASHLERTTPPVFVGRKRELDELRFAVAQVAKTNPKGMTRIVQGVPGAGKSSLCDEFVASVQGRKIGGRVLCAKLGPNALDLPPLRLTTELNEALLRLAADLPQAGYVASGLAHARRLASTAGQLGFKTSEYKLNDEIHGLNEHSSLVACINAYADHMWPDDAVLVLAVDEMQQCPITDRTIAAMLALNERLHAARIFVACFGLQSTARTLEDLGITRVADDAIIEIGPLGLGEGRQVLERTLDHFGVSDENEEWLRYVAGQGFGIDCPWPEWRRALVDRLEEQSADFPQHLTAALRSVCATLGEHRDLFSPENNLLEEIADRHDRNKRDYYDKRMGTRLRRHRTALGAIAKAAVRAPGDAILMQYANEALEAGDDRGRAVSPAKSDELIDLAVGRGVLGETEIDGDICCAPSPIPSLTAHMIGRFDQVLARGDAVAVALAEYFAFR